MEKPKSKEQTEQLLRRIALISGIVAFILCILIIANFIQVKRVDPLNTPAMTILLDRLKSDPGDDALRTEIRELDLLSRKAFFTSQWQIRTGGYILLACVLIVIICMKWIELIRPKIPPLPEPVRDRFWEHRKTNQRWIIYTGIFLVIGSFILAFLTYSEIGKTIRNETVTPQNETDSLAKFKPDQTQQEASRSVASKTLSASQPDSQMITVTINERPEVIQTIKPVPATSFPSRQEILNNSLTFRGPDGNGVVSGKNFPVNWNGATGMNIKWRAQIRLPGYNSPIVWKNRVFLSGASANKREVYCFVATTGEILWLTDVSTVPGTPSDVPKVDRETGLAAPTMTTDGQRVYAIFATGDLVALDMEGKLVWSKNLGMPMNHYGHSSSLIMYRNLLIVQWDQSKGASVKAFDGATGELVWNTLRDVRVSWASPILVNTGNKTELILAADPFVASYDPATGKENWRMNCIYGEVGPSVTYADGYLFATNEYAKLAAIKLGNPPRVAWELNDYLSDIPSPVANKKYLFLVTSYGVIVCYDAKTGEEYWISELENSTYASPVLVNDRVYQMDKEGIMHIFKADSVFISIGEPTLGEGSVCTPAFANGRIYIRGDENLYCIGK
ncbi:MAG: PQQ-binding-like beta-propeller repeat protein [Bacteroidia bacterium]|nr:PQQ-binding-like beta-propeller repeat protein [Bacteroidia bacterium]